MSKSIKQNEGITKKIVKEKLEILEKGKRVKQSSGKRKQAGATQTAEMQRYEDIHFVDSSKPVWNYSRFMPEDIRQYHEGTLYRAYDLFGSHPTTVLDTPGYYFAVWAPNATAVSVVGNFNNWERHTHELLPRLDKSGIWEGFIPHLQAGDIYKYHIVGFQGAILYKGDPYARYWEKTPATASVMWKNEAYEWKDSGWMNSREKNNALDAPWTVYEVHLASWMRPDKNNPESYNSYQQLKELLVPYVKEMGFTHVELMPVMEFPFDGSWGYQGAGYFAPTSRFGSPEDLMELIDAFHQEGIGVILDWVPSHFPYDSHGLFMFDGHHTYEYADMRKGYHPDWSSYIFNYERSEVLSFLISSARFWFEHYHIDAIRVDAVSSMLKLDYSRKEGEWLPNKDGGNDNLEAINFLKKMNEMVYRDFKGVQTIAEESTDWKGVTAPTSDDGLGFGLKWMMGWMHDTLDYFSLQPDERKDHQDRLTFSMDYFYHEKFMLPLSHDEIVHGKKPMLYKMPGDDWQQFANLRLLYTYMFTHPGGKLLFMGDEFGATSEWNFKTELQWDLLQYESHSKLKDCVRDLLHLVKTKPAFYEMQFEEGGFEWIEREKREEAVIAFKRVGKNDKESVLIVLNLTPEVRHDFPIQVKGKGKWKEIFNSNDAKYWGSGDVFNPEIKAKLLDKKQKSYELKLHLPALAAIILE